MEVSGARAAGIPTIRCDSVREIVSAEGTTVRIHLPDIPYTDEIGRGGLG